MIWKENANLFWNFDVQLDYDMLTESVKNILCHDYPLDGCTLIARRIEDMTDEEKRHYNSLLRVPKYQALETPESFLYALSIGCLPECFEWDKTVIDIKTL